MRLIFAERPGLLNKPGLFRRISTAARVVWFICLVLAVGIGLLREESKAVAQPPAAARQTGYVYLPLLTRYAPPPSGIYGVVRDGGIAMGNIPLTLRVWNGVQAINFATTTTDSNGLYSFKGMPTLYGGQYYYVIYASAIGDFNHLAWWSTRTLDYYIAGSNVEIGNFDIGNVYLTAPVSGTQVALPQTFTWTPRAAVPTDSYELAIFDPNNGPANWWASGLGYVGSYDVAASALPGSFHTFTPYVWDVWVYAPFDGYGESLYFDITFSYLGPGQLAPNRAPLPRRLDLPPPRRAR